MNDNTNEATLIVHGGVASDGYSIKDIGHQNTCKLQNGEAISSAPYSLLPKECSILAECLDGAKCPVLDELCLHLAQHLEMVYDEHPGLFENINKDFPQPISLEVEGRLGVILDCGNRSRLRLPVATTSVIAPALANSSEGRNWNIKFEAGVSSIHFEDIKFLIFRLIKQKKHCARKLLAFSALLGDHVWENYTEVQEEEEGKRDGGCVSADKANTGTKSNFPHSILSTGSQEDWTELECRETLELYYYVESIKSMARFTCLNPPEMAKHQVRNKKRSITSAGYADGLSIKPTGIYKQNIAMWNIYNGADKNEAFFAMEADQMITKGENLESYTESRVDYRVAVNFEHCIESAVLWSQFKQQQRTQQFRKASVSQENPTVLNITPKLQRWRKRQTFVHRTGMRVDLTEVEQSMPMRSEQSQSTDSKTKYEIEVELHPKQIAKALEHNKNTGDSRPLWCLCVSFLSLIRDLSVYLNASLGREANADSNGDVKPPYVGTELADLRPSIANIEETDAYKAYLGDTLPLIGDYSYRAVASQYSHLAAKNGNENPPKYYEFFRDKNVDEISLYTHSQHDISGPWIPCHDDNGTVRLVEFGKLSQKE